MKNIHPVYAKVKFQDRTTGSVFETRSTLGTPEEVRTITVDVTSDSHPLWTGRKTVQDSEGRVAAFERRYGKAKS